MAIEALATLSKMPKIFRLLKEMAMASLDEPMTFQAKVCKGMRHLVITLQVLASLFLILYGDTQHFICSSTIDPAIIFN